MRQVLSFAGIAQLIGLLLLNTPVWAQFNKGSIELMPFVRWDSYPSFKYAINPIRTNTLSIKGTSYGLGANYKLPVNEKVTLKAGIGYYRYSFNDIESFNSSFGKGNARVIDFVGVDVIYRTTKYWYHTVFLNIGAERNFRLTKDMQLFVGGSLQNFYSFRQYYKVVWNDYNRNIKGNFGFSALLQAGVTKQYKRFSFSPTLLLPVFDKWRQDSVFPGESSSNHRQKWFRGVGVGLGIGYGWK